MAKELEKRGNIVGSPQYFAELHTHGLLGRIIAPQSSTDYAHSFGKIADKTRTVMRIVLEDLAAAGPTLRFMEADNISRMTTAVTQLEKLCAAMQHRLDYVGDCLDYLSFQHRDTQLKSRADLRDLERGYDILHGSGSYDLPESRDKIFDMLLGGFISDAAYGEEDVARFADDLEGGNGREALQDLELYINYRENPRCVDGRWGEPVGSRRYLEYLEEEVFDSRLYSTELSKGDYTYGDSFEAALQDVRQNLIDDIKFNPYYEYIVYDNRANMMDFASNLAQFSNFGASAVEAYLKKFRRLEDFDNKVIEFDTRGTVRARMAWENGRNVMYIEADVYFIQGFLNDTASMTFSTPPSVNSPNIGIYLQEKTAADKAEFEKRVSQAMHGFALWAGTYSFFDGQVLEVKVTINRKISNRNAGIVIIADVNNDSVRSFATGQVFPHPFGWHPDKSKHMGLLKPIELIDNTGNTIHSGLAAHEFGHWLGLQDAYSIGNDWMPIEALRFPLTEIDPQLYPGFDTNNVMKYTKNINYVTFTPKEIEMVVLAFQTGQRQSYRQQFPWESKSEAWK